MAEKSRNKVTHDIPESALKDYFENTKKVIAEEDRLKFETVLNKISLIKQREEIIAEYKDAVEEYKTAYHPHEKLTKKVLAEDRTIEERKAELLGSDGKPGIEEKFNIMTEYKSKNRELKKSIRTELGGLLDIITKHLELVRGQVEVLEREGEDASIAKAAVGEMEELAIFLKEELNKMMRDHGISGRTKENKKPKETKKKDPPAEEAPAEETPAEETPAEETPAEGAPATATASPVTVAPAAGTSVGGGSGTARRTEHSSDSERDRRSERDVKKEEYLKLKDICDRLNMTDDELAAAGKEKVNEEEIKSLDEEFEKIYKGMLDDPAGLNKWDKRILASMLCKDRYYENTAEDKRAKFYLETKIKGIGPRILAWLKKMPKNMTEHKELLGKMVEFVENDRELVDDLKDMEKTDHFEDVKAVRDAVASAINKWNAAVTKDEAKCTATLTAGTSLAEELSDGVSPESPDERDAAEIDAREAETLEVVEDYDAEEMVYHEEYDEEYDDEWYDEVPVDEAHDGDTVR